VLSCRVQSSSVLLGLPCILAPSYMSNITTDFVTTTKKIVGEVRSVLTSLHLIREDVKVIREQVVSNSNKQAADQQENHTSENQSEGLAGRGQILNVNESDGEEYQSEHQTRSYLHDLVDGLKKEARKPRFIVELMALAGLAFYTCETRRTNDLTQKALNIQSSQSRAFVQITLTNFMKDSFEDVQKAGSFFVELQNVGRSTATKVYGDMVVEFPLAMEEPSLNLKNGHSKLIQAPLYPGAPAVPAEVIFISDYGTVPEIPPTVIEQLKHGTRYAVISGRINYEDTYGEWWTQFCGWRHYMPTENPPRVIGFAAKKCIDFNTEGGTPKKQ
jgi:hypothetical protein